MGKITRVQNLSQLANALGCTRQGLVNWRKDSRFQDGQPTAEDNGTYIVEKFKVWVEKYGLGTKSKGFEEDEKPVLTERQRLELRKLEIEVETKEVKLAKDRGELISRDLVPDLYARAMSHIYRELDRVFGDEVPPRTDGMTTKQKSSLHREEIRRVFGEAKVKFSEDFHGCTK